VGGQGQLFGVRCGANLGSGGGGRPDTVDDIVIDTGYAPGFAGPMGGRAEHHRLCGLGPDHGTWVMWPVGG
jgi:hypothetical protein